MRGLILAIQFLTRLPTPQFKTFDPAWLSDSARYFAVVGGIIGLFLAIPAYFLPHQPLLASLLILLVWVWITGGLHLDGLADLSDAMGAAHRSPERFLEVLKDPHVGSFGVISLVMQLILKWGCIQLLLKTPVAIPCLILIPAWARLFAVSWSATLPALAKGSGERFQWHKHWPSFFISAAVLVGLGLAFAPVSLVAPIAGLFWWGFLKKKLGGMTGDCLGAGIEVCEVMIMGLILPILNVI